MAIQTKTPSCYICNLNFNSWQELAHHIINSPKKKHPFKSRAWAQRYVQRDLLRQQIDYSKNFTDPDKERTEYGDTNRENSKLQLSGKSKNVRCFCPKCQRNHTTKLEIEFISLLFAWRINNQLVVICDSCRNYSQYSNRF